MTRKFALIIGNSEYDDSELARLKTPDADVAKLTDVLRCPEIGGFDEVAALADEPLVTVRRAIARFFAGKQRDDLLLLYFSGHGVLDDRGQLYLAVKDTERTLPKGTAIEASFITDVMDSSNSRRQVLILDCCHSGAFARGAKGKAGASVHTASAFEGIGTGRVVLTATDATQYAWEGDQIIGQAENSVFTRYLIQGLQSGEADQDQDGRVTLDELYDYVYEHVVQETPRQTPGKWSYKQQGDIIIANNPHPIVKQAVLPPEIQQSIDDSRPWVREGVIGELDRLLNGHNLALAQAAHSALKHLAEDDSRKVSVAAAQSLQAYDARLQVEAERREQERLAALAEQERLARLQAEEERLAKEKAEQERSAQLRAEQERLAQHRAAEERLAKERAEAEERAQEKAGQERLNAAPAEPHVATAAQPTVSTVAHGEVTTPEQITRSITPNFISTISRQKAALVLAAIVLGVGALIAIVALNPGTTTSLLEQARRWPAIAIADDFSQDTGQWTTGVETDETGVITREITDGHYRWSATSSTDYPGWHALPNNLYSATDFYVRADVTPVSGTCAAGVRFRHDVGNFYTFMVQNALHYAFAVTQNGKWKPIISWEEGVAPDLMVAGQRTTLEVIAQGSHFNFYINDRLVDQADNSQLAEGWPGPEMELGEAVDNCAVDFDYFEMRTPK